MNTIELSVIDQLVRSIRENVWTLVFRTDLTSFGTGTSKLRFKYFPVWTSQLVNKSIVLIIAGCVFQGVEQGRHDEHSLEFYCWFSSWSTVGNFYLFQEMYLR